MRKAIDSKESVSSGEKGLFALRRLLFRAFGWWAGFSWLYALSSQCPFCGQPGCPVGPLGTGLIGGLFSFLSHFIFRIFRRPSGHIHRE
ncbi:MAG: hypothetical protein NTX30_23115 [Deltaproteobacteria bacterium]|nr:hypothetical protein [Deltaproteobacteria bacterium]